jgi:hypothetical protein
MLSEWANRSAQVTLFTSIYSDQQEPGATLKRVPACRVQFAQADDRARVVLHRIFENYLDFKPASVAPVVESYLNVWRRHSGLDAEAYKAPRKGLDTGALRRPRSCRVPAASAR